MQSNEPLGRKLLRVFLRALPLLGLAGAGLWLLLSRQTLSIDTILSYSPERPILAALFMLLLFALKSISLMLPVLLLYTASGILFPLPLALLINILGTAITLSIPYLIGWGAGPDMTVRLQEKHPRLRELRALRRRNELFCSFLVRVIGILPCDVVSLYFGNTRLSYWKYLLGGVLGFLPDILTATVVGMKADDRSSPWFWGAIVLNLTVCIVATLFYRAYLKRRRAERGSAPSEEETKKSEKKA